MTPAANLACALIATAALSACARPPGNFEWGAYDESLYQYYRDSQNQDKLMTELDRLSVAYEIEELPELGEALARAASDDPQVRRRAVIETSAAMKPLDLGPQTRLAPGLVAELGYLHLEAGNPDKAIALFRREKRRWPESAYFMDMMIRVAKGPAKTREGDKAAIEAEAARLKAGGRK